MQEKGLFSEAFLVHESLFKRLCYGTREAFNEFSNDPRQFLLDAIKRGGPGGPRRRTLLRLGLAIGLLFYAGVFLATVVLWSVAGPKRGAKDDWVRIWLPPTGHASASVPVAEGPKNDKKPSGGGGGGDKSDRPPTIGQPPPYSLVPPIIAPTTRPQLNVPELPVPETLLVDPRLQPPRPEGVPTGMPDGAIGAPSDGPGSEHGIGSGRGGGIGNGPGKGLGPGDGWNTGGPKAGLGGIPSANERTRVDSPPVPLNRPRPNYTEAARKNKVQGLIRARVLVGANGSVQRVVVTRGLADGLDEEAIAAAYQMQFKAATKKGQSIACWVTLEIEFNLR